MARGMLHKVGGAQARLAEQLGYVKVDRATAERMVQMGVPVVVTGSRVRPDHILGGHRLSLVLRRGRPFRVQLAAAEDFFRKNPALGQNMAFFVLQRDYPRLLMQGG